MKYRDTRSCALLNKLDKAAGPEGEGVGGGGGSRRPLLEIIGGDGTDHSHLILIERK